ncbi:helix-turn-helix domain-containing protein [Pseudomonas aeruginosa]|uniref:helix-turn-helix domain-containing protein n=1 Tax=Pseudomonas aeruginosa TaxID=287 RepID=UPI001EED9C82|nr:helix-turn-helix domain-containing protein [Pseudomonas aeruginosa]MCG7130089.1 helix-turn-helix domain-containing protein [Pseudomonas aeruginosa]MCG7153262.1 helix-turn-helix domain-containing protein [Pseudomonas aeruginosa]MCG7165789.1 helix-turn-helix domain-containing protein [Pseudomonas aeruginosa]MCG7171653.1 helix-turn-helix domain-containing protein [Pseudomonas aeruginosa]HDP4807086.1 helix-turn-helix domain-containing protein [Pseudomonas aeruginosa]
MSHAAQIAPLAVGPEDAGRITGHARSAIYEAIASGELKSFKSGKRRLILMSELSLWIERKAKEGAR